MKKISEWSGLIREAEEKQLSELQKSYREYFSAKLNKFGAKSPADLSPEDKKAFFNEVTSDWEKGTGAKPAGKKDVEEHGVKESVETIAEGNISMYKSMVQNVLKDLDVEVRQSDIKVGTKKSDSWTFVTLNGHVLCSDTAYDQMVAWAKAAIKEDPTKYGLPASLQESEDVNESVLAVAGGVILGILGLKLIAKIVKKIVGKARMVSITDKPTLKLIVNELAEAAIAESGKNPVQVVMWKSAVISMIDTGEIKNALDIAKTIKGIDDIDIKKVFESESEEVNESSEDILKRSCVERLSQFFRVPASNLTKFKFDGSDNMKDLSKALNTSEEGAKAYYDVAIKVGKRDAGIDESEEVNEAEIKNAKDFKEYAETVLKKMHGDKYDQAKADEIIKGLSDEAEKSGDWGAAVGKLNA